MRPSTARRCASLVLAAALVVAGCVGSGAPASHAARIPAGAGQSASPSATASATRTLPRTPGTPPTLSIPPSPAQAVAPFAPTAPPSSAPTPPPQALVRRPSPTPGSVAGTQFTLHVPILMYHRIVPAALAGNSLPGLVISPALFDAQLGALRAAGWHTVTVAQIAAALAARTPLPPRTFAISIDDGWSDGYTYALPILQRYGDHATYFVPAARVGVLVNFLSPAELRTLAADGMEIANHTYSGDQIVLTDLSPAQVQFQIEAGAQRLASIVGTRPVTFAYPAGRYDLVAEQDLAADGFTMAVTEGGPSYVETWTNRFAVARVRISPSTAPAGLLALLRELEPGS